VSPKSTYDNTAQLVRRMNKCMGNMDRFFDGAAAGSSTKRNRVYNKWWQAWHRAEDRYQRVLFRNLRKGET
jgi:uncharacterized protein YukE